MLGHVFYHSSIRHIVVAFGSLFNDLTLRRLKDDKSEHNRIKVPLHYGPKETYIARYIQQPHLEKEIAITLPIMSFYYSNLSYDSDRHLIHVNRNKCVTDPETMLKQFNPVPYNLDFELAILVKNAEDGAQIVEQILPYFTPSFQVEINVIPELGLKDDMPVILNGVSINDEYEGEYEKRRMIVWTLSFTVKANFYGPITEQGVIKKAQVDILVPPGQGPVTDEEVAKTARSVRYTVEPDPLDATADDDYGFSEDIEFFDDGLKYNPVTGEDEEIP